MERESSERLRDAWNRIHDVFDVVHEEWRRRDPEASIGGTVRAELGRCVSALSLAADILDEARRKMDAEPACAALEPQP